MFVNLKSLQKSPLNSECEALAFGNRSALCHEIGHFQVSYVWRWRWTQFFYYIFRPPPGDAFFASTVYPHKASWKQTRTSCPTVLCSCIIEEENPSWINYLYKKRNLKQQLKKFKQRKVSSLSWKLKLSSLRCSVNAFSEARTQLNSTELKSIRRFTIHCLEI